MNFAQDSQILNPILKVRWAGWESDTLALQRAGWQLSANQSPARREFQIALKHKRLRMYGLSQMIRNFEYTHYFRDELHGFALPEIHIVQMSSEMRVNVMAHMRNFIPVSAEPIFSQNFEFRNIEDFKIFRPIPQPENRIIIDPNDTQKMLSRILELQSPKQAEIREKRNKEVRQFMRENATMAENIKAEVKVFAEIIV
jgi:hypothetical protein